MTEIARFDDLEGFVLTWEGKGLPKKSIAVVNQAVERSLAIAFQAKEAEDAAERGLNRRVGERVASGELDFEEGLAELARLGAFMTRSQPGQFESNGAGLRDAARTVCHKTAREFLQANAQRLAEEADPKDPQGQVRAWLERFAGLPG